MTFEGHSWTIVGGRGFVGSAIAGRLRDMGSLVTTPRHDEFLRAVREESSQNFGHVVYASGLAWEAARRPLDAYDVHVATVGEVLWRANYESFTYISSTRVYGDAARTDEDAPILCRPAEASDVYTISKIAGESACLTAGNPAVRVVRLSSVAGPSFRSELFLPDVLRQAATGAIRVRTARESAKDYIAIDDVAALIIRIATGGSRRLYNLASGTNLTHGEILDALVAATGAAVDVAADAPAVVNAPIDVSRVREEFDFTPMPVAALLPALVKAFGNEADRVRLATKPSK